MNNIYVNGYNVSIDEDGDEIVINFLLTTPQIDHENEGKLIAKTETAATVIMRRDIADTLSAAIRSAIEKKLKIETEDH